MMVGRQHWFLAFSAAIALHVLAALPLAFPSSQAQLAVQPGTGDGVTVGLGDDVGEEGEEGEEDDGLVAGNETGQAADTSRQEAPVHQQQETVAAPAPAPEPLREPVEQVLPEEVAAVEKGPQSVPDDAIVVSQTVQEQSETSNPEKIQPEAITVQAAGAALAGDAEATPVIGQATGHGAAGETSGSVSGKHGKRGRPGKGGRGGNGLKGYFHEVAGLIDSHKEYPDEVKKQKFEGKVVVAFAIGRSGKLLSSSIRKSSGNRLLDQAALDTLARASPFPPLPDSLQRESLKISVPIDYTLINN